MKWLNHRWNKQGFKCGASVRHRDGTTGTFNGTILPKHFVWFDDHGKEWVSEFKDLQVI